MDMQILIRGLIFPGAVILAMAIVNSAWYLRLSVCHRWLFAASYGLLMGFAVSRYYPVSMLNAPLSANIATTAFLGFSIGYMIAHRNKNCSKK